MKRKHKQILIIWVGLLAGLLIFRGGWMTLCRAADFPFGSGAGVVAAALPPLRKVRSGAPTG